MNNARAEEILTKCKQFLTALTNAGYYAKMNKDVGRRMCRSSFWIKMYARKTVRSILLMHRMHIVKGV